MSLSLYLCFVASVSQPPECLESGSGVLSNAVPSTLSFQGNAEVGALTSGFFSLCGVNVKCYPVPSLNWYWLAALKTLRFPKAHKQRESTAAVVSVQQALETTVQPHELSVTREIVVQSHAGA